MSHFAYGENSFTFLLFRAILASDAVDPGRAIRLLLSRLKPIIDPAATGPDPTVPNEWHSWLFPSFGKRYGFGEPDALVCMGNRTFWFEVETHVHLRKKIPAFEQSLLQLVRFRLFVNAVAKHWGRSRVTGMTLSGKGVPRHAAVSIAGHPVLANAAFRRSVEGSLSEGQDHYVLLSKSKPVAISLEDARQVALGVLQRHDRVAREWCDGRREAALASLDFEPLPHGRFWRVAWEGDLKDPMITILGADPLVGGGFISR